MTGKLTCPRDDGSATSPVSQHRLSDFSGAAPSERCPCCTDTDPEPKGYQDGGLLEHIYLGHDFTIAEVAELFSCSESTVKNWLRRHDLSKSRFTYEMPEDELRRLYLDEGHSINEIADHYDCSYIAVHNRLEMHDIPIRSPGEALRDTDADDSYRDEEWLREKYHGEQLSKQLIAEQCGVAAGTIQWWMDQHGIEARDYSDAQTQRNQRRGDPYMNADRLRRLYWEEGLTQRELAARFDCSQRAVQTWMNRHDIQLRHTGAHGNTYETARGEYVRSSHERRIANWLHENGVEYEYEPDTDAVDLRPDFKIDGNLVEYWGMLNREDYVERMHEKLDRYEAAGLQPVNLFPHDLPELNQKLGQYV